MIERKILVLGDSGVGKSALVQCFMGNSFSEEYRPTNGAVPYKKTIQVAGKSISLVIWDVAGHIMNIHPAFTTDAHGVILVCDLSRQVSTEPMFKWHKVVKEKIGDVPVLVAGNKSNIAIADSCEAMMKAGFRGHKTSARTGMNVELIFTEIVRATL